MKEPMLKVMQSEMIQSDTQTVDFRAVLKAKKSKDDADSPLFNSGQFDWKSQMKSKKSPKNLGDDELKEPSADIMGSPKLPPPNPIEVMSTAEKQKQKENTQILEVFQDFEDSMAQYDEEIDFKQSFAESI